MVNVQAPRSRRAILAAVAGAVGALIARAVDRPNEVAAANGDPVILGQGNIAASQTAIGSGDVSTLALTGAEPVLTVRVSSGAGTGIRSHTPGGAAVYGLVGPNGSGEPTVTAAGIAGIARDPGAGIGVHGEAQSGPGVNARSESGNAVNAASFSGAAIRAYSTSAAGVDTGSANGRALLAQTLAGTTVHAFTGNVEPPAPPTIPTAIYGEARGTNATGVWGYSAEGTGTGVYGESAIGVWGFGGWGVFGASGATGTGVYGFSGASVPAAPAHTGVFGYSDSGTGVYARAATGTALYVNGKARFSRSGKTYVSAGRSSRVVTMAGVTSSSYIIATPQTNRAGVFVQAVVPAAGKFTIYLNKIVAGTTYVGFLVIN